MVIASFAISCLAVVAALLAAWFAWGQKRAAERSAAEARRAADSAEAVAEVERGRRADELRDAERRRVQFDLIPEGGQRHLLRHIGTDPAFGVHVDTGDLQVHNGGESDIDEFEPGAEYRYYLARTMGTQTTHVVVTWHQRRDRSDEVRSMRMLVRF